MTVGIISIGACIPDTFQDIEEIGKISGVPESFFKKRAFFGRPVFKSRSSVELGVKAAEKAIKKAGILPEQISVLAVAIGGTPDYLTFSSSAKMHHKLGLNNSCICFEVDIQCASGPLVLKAGADQLELNGQTEYGLVITTNRISDTVNIRDPESKSMFDVGDGAAAAVIRLNEPANRILAYNQFVDGSLADEVVITCGGSVCPPWMEHEEKDTYISMSDKDRIEKLFKKHYAEYYSKVIRNSCNLSGFEADDIDLIVINQLPVHVTKEILDRLYLPYTKCVYEYPRTSHIGASDHMICFSRELKRGGLPEGGLVCFAGSGGGFHWNSLILQFNSISPGLMDEVFFPRLKLEDFIN
jgi:3-oxoacyl-[acyl-carrier-protein] synthase III